MKQFLLAPVMFIGYWMVIIAEHFGFNYKKFNPYVFGMMIGSWPHKIKEERYVPKNKL